MEKSTGLTILSVAKKTAFIFHGYHNLEFVDDAGTRLLELFESDIECSANMLAEHFGKIVSQGFQVHVAYQL
jgi:hypothetical protein